MNRLPCLIAIPVALLLAASAQGPHPGQKSAYERGAEAQMEMQRPPDVLHAVDISNEFEITVRADKAEYRQLEPIRLIVEVKSKSDKKFEYEVYDPYRGIDFIVTRSDPRSPNAPPTAAHKGVRWDRGGGGGQRRLLSKGEQTRFQVVPNLLYDMTWIGKYRVVAVVGMKDDATGIQCMVRDGQGPLIEIVRFGQGL